MSVSWILRLSALFALFASIAFAQSVVRGRVVDEHGAPVADARVWAKEERTALDAYTNPAGDFRLTVPAGERHLLTVERTGFSCCATRWWKARRT